MRCSPTRSKRPAAPPSSRAWLAPLAPLAPLAALVLAACGDTPPTASWTGIDAGLSVVLADTARIDPGAGGTAGGASASTRAAVPRTAVSALPSAFPMTDLGTLGGFVPAAINIHGQLAGTLTLSAPGDPVARHAYRWDPGAGLRDLGALPEGPVSEGRAINAAGQVAGSSVALHPINLERVLWEHAVVWDADGTIHDLGALGTLPGRPYSRAEDINDDGWVVGVSFAICDSGDSTLVLPHPCNHRATLWPPGGGPQDLGGLRVPWGDAFETSHAYAINNARQVVGRSLTAVPDVNPTEHAFFWEEGAEMIDLGPPEPGPGFGWLSTAEDVNAFGQVAGWLAPLHDADFRRAFVWDRATGLVDLGSAPASEFYGRSVGSAINDSGHVVGWASIPNTSWTAAIAWTRERGIVDLGALGNVGTSVAVDVNNAGQAVGTSNGHVVLWDVRGSPGVPPTVDRVQAVVLPPGNPTGLTGTWLRVRLRDAGDPGPWTWSINWGDGLVHRLTVARSGEFAFLRQAPYALGGVCYTVVVSATDLSGHPSAPATTYACTP